MKMQLPRCSMLGWQAKAYCATMVVHAHPSPFPVPFPFSLGGRPVRLSDFCHEFGEETSVLIVVSSSCSTFLKAMVDGRKHAAFAENGLGVVPAAEPLFIILDYGLKGHGQGMFPAPVPSIAARSVKCPAPRAASVSVWHTRGGAYARWR
ncbi:hypothetical protein VDGL01_12352 [Verticillium dahliae]